MRKLLRKLRNWSFYKTSTSKCGDYTLTDVKPRFKNIRPKRKYKTMYTVVEEKAPTIIYNE